jgi:hypothetical protein
MTTQTESLRSLTLEVISNYRKTAKFATQALRSGSTRSISKVDSALTKYEGKFGETVKSTLDVTQEKIVAATDKADEALGKIGNTVKSTLSNTQDAIVTATDMADSAVDKFLGDATKRIAKFPPKTGKLAGFLKKDVVKSVESFGIPGAKLVRFVSSKLADGAEQLSIQVAGNKKKAAPARKVVTKATKTVAKAVKKTTRKVKAAVAA